MTTELVTATHLRPGDILVPTDGRRFALQAIEHIGANVVKLRSEGYGPGGRPRWFTVLASTRFVRVVQDRTIDTRPDLRTVEVDT